jgi:hypothetical protein
LSNLSGRAPLTAFPAPEGVLLRPSFCAPPLSQGALSTRDDRDSCWICGMGCDRQGAQKGRTLPRWVQISLEPPPSPALRALRPIVIFFLDEAEGQHGVWNCVVLTACRLDTGEMLALPTVLSPELGLKFSSVFTGARYHFARLRSALLPHLLPPPPRLEKCACSMEHSVRMICISCSPWGCLLPQGRVLVTALG